MEMSNVLLNNLISRKEYLQNLILQKNEALTAAPEGTLRVSLEKGRYRYYRYNGSVSKKGQYLGEKRTDVAAALAQKDYDQRIIKAGEKELQLLDRMIRLQEVSVEDVYDLLSPARRELVKPIRLPDGEYIAYWLDSKKCEPMGFADDDPVILTSEGYRVRSKSEQLWADTLSRLGVPHVFEPLLYLEGRGWVRPDFAGLNVRKRKEIYVEHLGMMDDPGYSDDNVEKLHDYERNGLIIGDSLIITMETKKYPLDARSVEELIKRHFL